MNKTDQIFRDYNDKIEEYLKLKFPDVPEVSIKEACAYIAQSTVILVNDVVYNQAMQMRRNAKEMLRDYNREKAGD